MSDFKNNAQDVGQKARKFIVNYGLPIVGAGFLGSHFYNICDGLTTQGDNPFLKEYNAAIYSFSSGSYLVSNWLEKKNIDGQRLGNTINLLGGSFVLAGACQEHFSFMAAASIVALATNFRSSYFVKKKNVKTPESNTIQSDTFVQAGAISTGLNSIYGTETAFEMFIKNNSNAPAAQVTWPFLAGILLARNIFVAQDRIQKQNSSLNLVTIAPA